MKLKTFTFGFSDTAHGFDDTSMQDFLADKEVIEFSEHFFVHEKTPYLSVLVAYRNVAYDEGNKAGRGPDPRKELDADEKKTYDALRAWRAARAKQEGLPPYLIATNKQLAHMVTRKAAAKEDLAKVRGIGDTKIAQYGDEILKIIVEGLAKKTPGETGSEQENAS